MPIYKMDGKRDGLQKYRVRINYTDRDGKPKQIDRVAYGKDAAKELERSLAVNLREETTSKMTIQDLYNEYMRAKQYEVREATMAKSARVLKAYILPKLGNTRIDRLNNKILQDWKNEINTCKTKNGAAPLSLGYKQRIYTEFLAMLNFAVKMEYIPKDPLAALGNFKDAYEAEKKIDFYTAEEFEKYIAEAKNQAEEFEKSHNSIHEWNYYVFFCIAFYTGARKGEIHALKWSDIDGNIINISRSITQKLKGEDRETPPKNKRSSRSLQIPAPLEKVLNEHLNRCKTIDGFSEDWRICGGLAPLRDTTIEKRNAAYAKAAGLKKSAFTTSATPTLHFWQITA